MIDLPVSDVDTGRTLIAYGVHEHLSTDTFRREIRRLATRVEGDVTSIPV